MQMTLNKESPLRLISHSISHSPKLLFVFLLKNLIISSRFLSRDSAVVNYHV